MINTVKKELEKYIDKKIIIKYNLGRNKYETYKVTVKTLYSNVFVVEEEKEEGIEIKCFSYNDIIMKNIKIYEEK
jgi:Uncharacterized protein conserved in bacteria